MAELSKLSVTLAADHADEDLSVLLALLARHIPHGWEEESLPTGEMRFVAYFTHEDFSTEVRRALSAAMPALLLEEELVEETNWVEAWKEYFTPVEAGTHFLVLAPWMTEERESTRRTPIIIEPKAAFGTGHHATTALCLEAISLLAGEARLAAGMRFLDLGTGTGILGIACVTLGLTGEGLDIDPAAVDNARENKEANAVAPGTFDVRRGDVAEAEGPYDVILANILAGPLKDMAPQIAALPGTRHGARPLLLLSGILEIQADDVAKSYVDQGFPSPRRLKKDEWVALLFV